MRSGATPDHLADASRHPAYRDDHCLRRVCRLCHRHGPGHHLSGAPAVGGVRRLLLPARRDGCAGLEVPRPGPGTGDQPGGGAGRTDVADGRASPAAARSAGDQSLGGDADPPRHPLPGPGDHRRRAQPQCVRSLPACHDRVRHPPGAARLLAPDRPADLVRRRVRSRVRGGARGGRCAGRGALDRAADRVAADRFLADRRRYRRPGPGMPVPRAGFAVAASAAGAGRSRPGRGGGDEGDRLARPAGRDGHGRCLQRPPGRGEHDRDHTGCGRRGGRPGGGPRPPLAGAEHHRVPARPDEHQVRRGQPAAGTPARRDRACRAPGRGGPAGTGRARCHREPGDPPAADGARRDEAPGDRADRDVRAGTRDQVRLLRLPGRSAGLAGSVPHGQRDAG